MLIAFAMPVFSALFAIYMPDVEPSFNYIVAGIYIANFVIFIMMLAIFKKKKRQNAVKLTLLFNMLTFCLFFTFPFVKAFMGNHLMQILLILVFLCLLALGVYDQKQEVPLVFPDSDKEHRKFAFVFYAIPVVTVVLGGGGNIIIVRWLSDFFGYGFVTYWGGGVLYIMGCWFAFFFQSLFYQGLVKKGVLVK